MSVQQHPEPQSTTIEALAGATCVDERAALTHAAYVTANFVIARWQEGSRLACRNLSAPHDQSMRARWYARTQQGLQEWIDRGGFSQPADDKRKKENDGIAPPFSGPITGHTSRN